MSVREEPVFISSNEEDGVIKKEINNKVQEVNKKSKKNIEKIKKNFEKEIKIDKIQVIKELEPEIIKEPEVKEEINLEEIKIEELETQVIEEVETQVIKEPELEVKLEEIKIEETIQDIKDIIKEEFADISNNIILPDFSNKSITEIFLYIKQKYEDITKQDILDNEIINYYTKINCLLIYNDIVIIDKLITSNSTLFDEIEKLAQDIIKNGNIETKNIPDLICIIQIIYERLIFIKELKLDTKKVSKMCVTIIKFIFHSLLDKNKIQIENLTHLDQIIETSISLLNYKSLLTPKSCCSIM
jgi:hypothetical protein